MRHIKPPTSAFESFDVSGRADVVATYDDKEHDERGDHDEHPRVDSARHTHDTQDQQTAL